LLLNIHSSSGKLSQAIINNYFPLIQAKSRQAHFTSLTNFKSILSSQSIRLYSLLDKIGEQEFKPFSDDFGLTGYVDDANGEPYYKKLMADLYYMSFTQPTPSNEAFLWDVFGKNGTGVKIHFDITVNASRSELRPIRYSSEAKAASALIKKLTERIKIECNRQLILRGISRIGAFYLPLGHDLEKEEETRLLIKSYGEGQVHDRIEFDGIKKYIPIKLGDENNQFCEVELMEVQVGASCNKSEVLNLLNDAGFDNVKLSDAYITAN
jgi:hypothetical protein